jgi:hypothetical protein
MQKVDDEIKMRAPVIAEFSPLRLLFGQLQHGGHSFVVGVVQKRCVMHPSASSKRLCIAANLPVANSIVLAALQPPIQFGKTMRAIPSRAPLHYCIWIWGFKTSETVLGPRNKRDEQRVRISVAAQKRY